MLSGPALLFTTTILTALGFALIGYDSVGSLIMISRLSR
jgi:hypothetical protein